MNEQRDETAEKLAIVRLIAANFGANLSAEITKMWLELLAGYTAGVCRKAALSLIKSATNSNVPFRMMPPFGMMQREIDALTCAVRGKENVELQAHAAWDALMSAVERHGSYCRPELDETTAYTVRVMGGWRAVCLWTDAEIPWRRKEFFETWVRCHGKTGEMLRGIEAVMMLAHGKTVNRTGLPR